METEYRMAGGRLIRVLLRRISRATYSCFRPNDRPRRRATPRPPESPFQAIGLGNDASQHRGSASQGSDKCRKIKALSPE
jgi:hypothetical protein